MIMIKGQKKNKEKNKEIKSKNESSGYYQNLDFEKVDFDTSFGLYLHIPFCESLCNYCNFYSETHLNQYLKKFLQTLKREIKIFGNHLSCTKLKTIYIGGGTPSLLNPDNLGEILDYIFDNFSFPEEKEITLEANPSSINFKKLRRFKKVGINRLSLGVQSFKDSQLQLLGRNHSANSGLKVIKDVKKVFDNFNLDLIFAIPEQTLSDWKFSLKSALNLSPAHISLYNLEIKKDTLLSKKINDGEVGKISEEFDAEMYNYARGFLTAGNYNQYEISNFARQGLHSHHNLLYWKFKPYLGLGPGAHSFNGKNRFYNYHDVKKYINCLTEPNNNHQKRLLPINEIITLNKCDLQKEMIIMGLRLIKGVNKREFEQKFGLKMEQKYGSEIEELVNQGLLKNKDKYLCLTDKGLLFGNKVFRKFI